MFEARTPGPISHRNFGLAIVHSHERTGVGAQCRTSDSDNSRIRDRLSSTAGSTRDPSITFGLARYLLSVWPGSNLCLDTIRLCVVEFRATSQLRARFLNEASPPLHPHHSGRMRRSGDQNWSRHTRLRRRGFGCSACYNLMRKVFALHYPRDHRALRFRKRNASGIVGYVWKRKGYALFCSDGCNDAPSKSGCG